MTQHEQRTRIHKAANLIGEARLLLAGVQRLDIGSQAFDFMFTAQTINQALHDPLHKLDGVRGPNEPAGYEEGEDK